MKRFLFLLLSTCTVFAQAQQINESIHLNQIGFYPKANKIAVVAAPASALNFYVTSTNLRDTFFRGQLTDTIKSLHSTTTTRIADFSALIRKGSYVLLIPGIGHSSVFKIDDNVFSAVGEATLKGFYYQRISMPLDAKYAGKWHRSAGHPDTEILVHPSAASIERPAGTILSMPGGWYDAGDYNKYIVNSGITMATLLSAYEGNKAFYATQQLNIPESANQLPDILDEVLYNLRWMMAMQDPNDGGVYHKCTNASFDGMVMPGITKEPRYVVQKSTAAALDFAAVMAQSARTFAAFKKQLPGLSDSCIKSAKNAWEWAIKNPNIIYDQDKLNEKFLPKIVTGAYGDGRLNDEWLWAAAELFSTTSDEQFLKPLQELEKVAMLLPAWSDVGVLAFYTLLDYKGEVPSIYKDKWELMRKQILKMADDYVGYASMSAFKMPMGQKEKDFIWGSSANAANQGILLLYAYKLTGKKIYVEAAMSNADYLLGRNATGYCFVTGFGSKSPMHPHHRPSVADGITEPVPGLLVGGPNPFRQDNCVYKFVERETAYTDDDCSYASNEIAINWNAPAVYLFNALDALIRKW
jgi:endoglucanase